MTMPEVSGLSDEDFRRAILRSIRLLAIVTVIALPLLWWKAGWQTAALLLVGAVISGSGLWEWLRLMSVVMSRMDQGEAGKPAGPVLIGFFLRLGGTVVVLYGSLKLLDGSVYALAAGLGLGVLALTVEALRIMQAWTA